MAHFAELGMDNKVLRVIVVHNNELLDETGQESEAKGQEFCRNLFGGTWVQTSYNATFRKHFAGTGYTYNSALDAFIPPKPYPSWILNESTCTWQAPVAHPTDIGTADSPKYYQWDETAQSWIQVTI